VIRAGGGAASRSRAPKAGKNSRWQKPRKKEAYANIYAPLTTNGHNLSNVGPPATDDLLQLSQDTFEPILARTSTVGNLATKPISGHRPRRVRS
jgi:hypothetical protein